ncbi:MAG TPA: hypothetical protein VLX92_08940 [Kofleriaceae bacterium]|nr:hypothetical protein [Kofleriaceae bacterium]
MRRLVAIAVLLIGAGVAHAAPCVNVTSPHADDVEPLRRALVAAFPETPHTCIDVSVVRWTIDVAGGDLTLAATVHAVVSDDTGRVRAMLSGGATVHVRGYRARRMPTYRRDALEDSVAGMLPALRAHVATPPRDEPTS